MPKSTNPLLRRRATSSSSTAPKRKNPTQTDQDNPLEPLNDTGLPPSLAPKNVSQDVETLIRYIHAHTWSDIPSRVAGMGGERISEVLRFRAALPRIVSLAHLLALSGSRTATERELARMVAGGAVRKVVVPGRGKGGGVVGEGVVLAEDWKRSVREEQGLEEGVKEKYVALLDAWPVSATAPVTSFEDDEVRQLVQAGYFTSPSALASGASALFAPAGSSYLSHLSASGSKAATGSLAAVGGLGAVHESGGSGSMLATSATRTKLPSSSQQMTFSLPATGAYLKLLISARNHLTILLKQISPRYKEATRDLLEEKWDGNVPNDATSRAKRARGEWADVLPGKTRKWREFCGLRFEWVLAEAVGSGVVEVFETGSVGLGVRVC